MQAVPVMQGLVDVGAMGCIPRRFKMGDLSGEGSLKMGSSAYGNLEGVEMGCSTVVYRHITKLVLIL